MVQTKNSWWHSAKHSFTSRVCDVRGMAIVMVLACKFEIDNIIVNVSYGILHHWWRRDLPRVHLAVSAVDSTLPLVWLDWSGAFDRWRTRACGDCLVACAKLVALLSVGVWGVSEFLDDEVHLIHNDGSCAHFWSAGLASPFIDLDSHRFGWFDSKQKSFVGCQTNQAWVNPV